MVGDARVGRMGGSRFPALGGARQSAAGRGGVDPFRGQVVVQALPAAQGL